LAGDLDITDPLDILTTPINGIAPIMTIDASHLEDRVFDVHPRVRVTMSNLIIQNGQLGDGGVGIRNQGNLDLSNVIVRFNKSLSRGGGIENAGILTLVNSTIGGNETAASDGIYPTKGGGIWNEGRLRLIDSSVSDNVSDVGGGIFNSSSATDTVDIVRSTVSRNDARLGLGAGLHNEAGPNVPVYIENSTFSGNHAYQGAFHGGAIWNDGTIGLLHSTVHDNLSGLHADANGAFILVNTIIAEKYSYSCTGSGIFSTIGRNLDSDNTCQLNPAIGDIPGVDPLLGPLQSNGGPTETHALLAGSPAIDAADSTFCLPIDQRGIARPQGAGCDIGAYELPARRVPRGESAENGRQHLFLEDQCPLLARCALPGAVFIRAPLLSSSFGFSVRIGRTCDGV